MDVHVPSPVPPPAPPPFAPSAGEDTRPPAPSGRVPWQIVIPAGALGILLLAAVVVMAVSLNDRSRTSATGNPPTSSPPTARATSPTSQAPSSSAPVASGYTLYDGGDFKAAYPTGWTVTDSGGQATFRDPAAGVVRGISAFKSTGLFVSNAVTLDQVSRRLRESGDYRTYHEVNRRNSVPLGGHDAAELEFTFTKATDGKDMQGRVKVRVFQVSGGAEAILLAASQKDWDGGLSAYEEFCKSFQLK
ncbi:hypothetical protein AB0J52_18395 [Spirillospora sp. NPDC049652]